MRNAMTAELTEACEGSAFCSGADLSWLDQGKAHENTPDQLRDKMLPFYRTWLSVRDLPVPVIAAINGPAIGAGLCLALACDIRYVSPTAVLSAPFTQIGTHAGLGATWLLKESIGIARTRDLLYTGRSLDANDAVRWGLASDIADDVVGHAIDAAARIAASAPIATRLTKAGLARLSRGLESTLEWEALAQAVTMASDDIHEGIEAVRNHRTPSFRGK
jgi:enoyl-CoA hydratase/carnithine racemase